jgi:hypothetical protein
MCSLSILPLIRSLIATLNTCATMLAGAPGHASFALWACGPPPLAFILWAQMFIYIFVFPFTIFSDFTYGQLGRAYKVHPTVYTCATVLTHWLNCHT